MSDQNNFITHYSQLEGSIRSLMVGLFSGTCSMCTACCCRADICEEAIQSAFLSLLLEKQGLSEDKMDEKYGWLDLHGCSLQYGRPPICYTYYCDELLVRLPNDETQFAAKVLGNLIQHIGEQALGDWHLVEIRNSKDLVKLDYPTLFQRLEESTAALQVIQTFLESGRLTKADYEILNIIPIEEP